MSVISEIKKLEKQQKIDDENRKKRYEDRIKHFDEERDTLYKLLRKNLFEIDGYDLFDYKFKIKEDKQNKILTLFVNDVRWFTFEVEERSTWCGCEGPCEHEINCWYTVGVYSYEIDENKHKEYFSCYNKRDFIGGRFPSAIFELIKDMATKKKKYED